MERGKDIRNIIAFINNGKRNILSGLATDGKIARGRAELIRRGFYNCGDCDCIDYSDHNYD